MPVHDWSLLDQGVFHSFHIGWIASLSASLNTTVWPHDHYSMGLPPVDAASEVGILRIANEYRQQHVRNDCSSVVTETAEDEAEAEAHHTEFYGRRRRSIGIFSAPDETLVGLIEIISPGNKSTAFGIEQLLQRLKQAFDDELSVLVVDIHQRMAYDPQGIHGVITEEFANSRYALRERGLTIASYQSGLRREVCVRHLAFGCALPNMPFFLGRGRYVNVPLEETYQAAFQGMPRHFKQQLMAN